MDRYRFEQLCLSSFNQLISFSTVHNKTYQGVFTGIDCGNLEDLEDSEDDDDLPEPGYITVDNRSGSHEVNIDSIDLNTVQFHKR